jgi:hypothetical protein
MKYLKSIIKNLNAEFSLVALIFVDERKQAQDHQQHHLQWILPEANQ